MDHGNKTSDFILLGLFDHTIAHHSLFGVVLAVTISSLLGNGLMVFLIHQDPRLHTPMYFLLSQLSLMDMMLVCTTVPKMAAAYLTGRKSISAVGCGLQIFFFQTTGGAECFLLAAMSYDRYVAVCQLLCDTSAFKYIMYICCVLMLLITLFLILTSSSLLLAAVLHMCSTEASKKASATCISH
ncbi:Olfactory receptor 2T33 [Fukomys damarensis]|uniref:Olfactory receptor 2T33 n=1 Tax=Fukomys damarensis TaxID=885580 RepID=A0A091CTF1_FUKDA|nr:Olfactory receptor 2T33 [Fukomys damarensis]